MIKKSIKDMLIGTLLGDAHIGLSGFNKAFISFEQSKKKLAYLNYLYDILKKAEFNLKDPVTYSRIDPRYSKKDDK